MIAESYERIHRSNLIGMGVLPLQFPEGQNADSLGLTGEETVDITGVDALNDTIPDTVHVKAGDAEFDAVVRIDTPGEADYYRHGGIMPYVLRQLLGSGPSSSGLDSVEADDMPAVTSWGEYQHRVVSNRPVIPVIAELWLAPTGAALPYRAGSMPCSATPTTRYRNDRSPSPTRPAQTGRPACWSPASRVVP